MFSVSQSQIPCFRRGFSRSFITVVIGQCKSQSQVKGITNISLA